MDALQYRVVIGLEIHIQLSTESKLFCSCPNRFGDEPNTNVCPVCLGHPGVLPVMNRRALEYALKTAIALNCRINTFTKWDRKSYYYPDLPKNYQISQYDLPLGQDGYMMIESAGELKKIRIRRLHLEEDAGKLIHAGDYSLVDLNRTGAPLMEIVTEPDISSPEEAYVFAAELRRLVRHLGVSSANMEQGRMRIEPNINLIITEGDREYKTPIVEIKNLGSLKAIERACSYEVTRQLANWRSKREVMQPGNKSTRGWDEERGLTVLQREKEEAHDYRYFPDPDLLPVVVEEDMIENIKRDIPEQPALRVMRFRRDYNLSDVDANTIVEDRRTADLFEEAIRLGAPVKVLANHFISFWAMYANERGVSIADLGIDAERLAQLAKLVNDGVINSTAASKIAGIMLDDLSSPDKIAERENLLQLSDISELETIVNEVIAANPQAVDDATRPGKKQAKAFGFLLGQVMRKTSNKANPSLVSELLRKKLYNNGSE